MFGLFKKEIKLEILEFPIRPISVVSLTGEVKHGTTKSNPDHDSVYVVFDEPLIVDIPSTQRLSYTDFNKSTGWRIIWGQGEVYDVHDWKLLKS